jgi:anti-sigma B factor antagonist
MDAKAGLEITHEENVAIASFTGSCICDVEEITSASARLKEFIETQRPARMVVDFSDVKFFSSQVLGLLLDARARLEVYHGELAITSLSPQLERVFRITNLDQIFTFYPDRAAAVGSMGGPTR